MTNRNLIPPKHRRRNNGENTRRHGGPTLTVALRLAGVAVCIAALAYIYR